MILQFFPLKSNLNFKSMFIFPIIIKLNLKLMPTPMPMPTPTSTPMPTLNNSEKLFFSQKKIDARRCFFFLSDLSSMSCLIGADRSRWTDSREGSSLTPGDFEATSTWKSSNSRRKDWTSQSKSNSSLCITTNNYKLITKDSFYCLLSRCPRRSGLKV